MESPPISNGYGEDYISNGHWLSDQRSPFEHTQLEAAALGPSILPWKEIPSSLWETWVQKGQ